MEHTIEKDGICYSLTDLEKDSWISIFNGSLRSKDKFHNATVANLTDAVINMRTVVLRSANVANKTLTFHTDTRTGKWADLKKNNAISWLFYDAAGRVQIRAGGVAALHFNDDLTEAAWLKSTTSSRKIYLGENAPSEKSETPTSGLPTAFESNDPTIEESEAGRKNFGVVVTQVNWMEWLWLNSKGHTRASFEYTADHNYKAKWLVP